MKRILAIIICGFVVTTTDGKQIKIPDSIVNEPNAAMRKMKIIEYIFNSEIKLNKCEVSQKDSEEILKKFLEIDKINLDTFKPAVEKGNALLKALRIVLSKNENPAEVYNNEKLDKLGFSRREWNLYVTKYKTLESLKGLERMIPDNMDIILETGGKSLKRGLEHWLLFQYIQKNTETKPEESSKERQMLWWTKRLADYEIPPETKIQKNELLRHLYIRPSYSKEKENVLRSYFKNRLQLIPDTQPE